MLEISTGTIKKAIMHGCMTKIMQPCLSYIHTNHTFIQNLISISSELTFYQVALTVCSHSAAGSHSARFSMFTLTWGSEVYRS